MRGKIRTITELKELCENIGIKLEVIPMYRTNYLNVAFEPHLDSLLIEYSPSQESAAVRAAVRELRYSGLLGDPRF
jgi:hypothetical protein